MVLIGYKLKVKRKQESYMNDDLNMNKDATNLFNHSASTLLNIVQMTKYRVEYVRDKDAAAKEKMYKHAFFAGVGILSLLTIGVLGLMQSQNNP